jgi:multicomponent Na+:H+ antiporter subunit F
VDVNILVLDVVIFTLLGISILSMFRVVMGPTPQDRLIGLNLALSQVLGILVVVAVKFDRSIYLDVALVYAILGFIGILAIARYLGDVK